jgi:23S rRNA (cytosine1962-C5)-methyltransferase
MVEFPDKQWKDYELLDSGCGEKLERFGSVVMARPEPKALWNKSLPEAEWKHLSHVAFKLAGSAAKSGAIEDRGTWERHKKIDDQWYISYPGLQDGLKFRLRLGLTAFKHVGVFPEQAPNWEFIFSQVRRLASDINRPKVLNLFAYTGGASLAAKAAGADVTHLDSIKQVVTWARGNMEASGMDGIRWIVEDAMKFVQREERRGNLYDGIILDPPAYGHGPNGEKWKLDESLFGLLKSVAHILKPKDSFMVLNLYSNGYSAALGETLVREAFGLGSNGRAMPVQSAPCGSLTGPLPVAAGLSSGELALPDPFGKTLPLSIYVRLTR